MMLYEKYWKQISQIYLLTKHYILLAEEMSDEFDTFLQPLKEHRDAFDHIVRVYGIDFVDGEIPNKDSYCLKNMSKALGHEYRAFFDTADWLSYICRQKIRKILSERNADEIKTKYPNYDKLKDALGKIPQEIATIRENKDISDDEEMLISEVEKYKLVLDELVEAYNLISQIF